VQAAVRTVVALMMAGVAGLALALEVSVRLSAVDGVALLQTFDYAAIASWAPGNVVCVVAPGEKATVLEGAAIAGSSASWLRVRMTSGTCAGSVGWIKANDVEAR